MTDALLTSQDQEEALSRAYVRAVAAMAGYTVTADDLDRDGIDLRIRAGGPMRPALDLQLKATVNLGEARDGYYHYPLDAGNYKSLRIETMAPRLLVVLGLPYEEEQWLTITDESLVMRRCAYWLDLKGAEERENVSSVTVRIPVTNVFNVENLRSLMEQARKGSIR